MACHGFSAALSDNALGGALEPTAAAHLAICSACEAHLAGERELAQIIERAVASVGSVQPAADFRVRLAEPTRGRALPARNAWRLAPAITVAAVIPLIVLGLSWSRALTRQGAATAPEAPATKEGSGFAPLAAPPSIAPVRSIALQASEAIPPATRVRAAPPDFAVLVPPGQRESLERFVMSLSQQDPVVVSRLLGYGSNLADTATIDETMTTMVAVTTMVIQPVVVPTLVVPNPILTN